MAQSNHERVGRALELLNEGLKPYVERELKAAFLVKHLAIPGKRSRTLPIACAPSAALTQHTPIVEAYSGMNYNYIEATRGVWHY